MASSDQIRRHSNKVAVVFGTRPEIIKLWPVVEELKKSNLEIRILNTGQQKHLSAQATDTFQIEVDLNLNLMTDSQSPSIFLSEGLRKLEEWVVSEEIDFIVVQGDTLSAFLGSLVAFLNKIPVGHVEAGLRSGNLFSPWPEEGLRKCIDAISTKLWTINDTYRELSVGQVTNTTGNTIIDSLSSLEIGLSKRQLGEEDYIVITLHRRENFGQILESALENIEKLAMIWKKPIYFFEHPNPRIKDAIRKTGFPASRNVLVSPPMEYREFLNLISKASLLITDSGGIQEEATFFDIPMIVLRSTTERPEALSPRLRILSRPDGTQLLDDFKSLQESNGHRLRTYKNQFGDGRSSEKIVRDIVRFFEEDRER